jgi:tRNA U34 2-thiouridine synthase MnmA/TrmU
MDLNAFSYSNIANENIKGYDLSAIFMRNWDTRDESGSDTGCEWEKDWEDVQRVCKTLDLPCRMVSTPLLRSTVLY